MLNEKDTEQLNPVKKVLAIIAIPAVFYLSGAMVIAKTLELSGLKPLWRDFVFFSSVNQGLSLFAGQIAELLWLSVVISALAAPFVFKKLRFYPFLLVVFALLMGIAWFSSGSAAAYKMANLTGVEFEFDQANRVPENIKASNLHHRLKLVLAGPNDYLVIAPATSRSAAMAIRIPINEVRSVVIESL